RPESRNRKRSTRAASRPTHHSPLTAHPTGVSLSEVLVSMLVMSIGVVAVATLFPLSVLRTIQATQLTNGAQLRYNFEGLSGSRPELINGAGTWQATTQYFQGDIVVSSIANDRYYECAQAGTSGAVEPGWKYGPGTTTPDNGVTWATHVAKVYMVDPLGWQERTQELSDLGYTPQISTADVRNTFGRTALGSATAVLPNAAFPSEQYRIVRFRGGIAQALATANPNPSNSIFPNDTRSANAPGGQAAALVAAQFGARDLATLADSWLLQT